MNIIYCIKAWRTLYLIQHLYTPFYSSSISFIIVIPILFSPNKFWNKYLLVLLVDRLYLTRLQFLNTTSLKLIKPQKKNFRAFSQICFVYPPARFHFPSSSCPNNDHFVGLALKLLKVNFCSLYFQSEHYLWNLL